MRASESFETLQVEETYLGGVASQKLGRLSNSSFSNGFLIHGYGFFFTTKRLIGVSYRRFTLVAYLIPFGIFLLWLGILLPLMSWGLKVDPNGFPLPGPAILFVPPLIGLPILSALFVLYLSPRRVRNKIKREKPTSIQDMMLLRTDIALERENISQIIIDKNPDVRFHFPRANINMKTGEWYSFDVGHGGFFELLGNFCKLTPPISLIYSPNLARKSILDRTLGALDLGESPDKT